MPTHIMDGAGYNRCGPWTPHVYIAACLCLQEHLEQKGEGEREVASSVRHDMVPQAFSQSPCLLISPQGIARDLALSQPHLSYSLAISGV